MIEASTKRCTRSGFFSIGLRARLDRRRIAVIAIVGEQEDIRLEAALALDLIGLGGEIALLDGFLVGEEGRGVEGVGLDLLFLEAIGVCFSH